MARWHVSIPEHNVSVLLSEDSAAEAEATVRALKKAPEGIASVARLIGDNHCCDPHAYDLDERFSSPAVSAPRVVVEAPEVKAPRHVVLEAPEVKPAAKPVAERGKDKKPEADKKSGDTKIEVKAEPAKADKKSEPEKKDL